MNREFLKGLGLEDEAVDKIMAEHGKTVNSTKEELTGAQSELESLKEQIKDRDTQLADLSTKAAGHDELKNQIESLRELNRNAQADYEQKLTQRTLELKLDNALLAAKARNPKAVKGLLDMDIIKVDGENVIGLTDQINALMESDAYLFDGGEPAPKPNHYNPGGGKGNDPKPFDPAEAGRQKAMQRHSKKEEQ